MALIFPLALKLACPSEPVNGRGVVEPANERAAADDEGTELPFSGKPSGSQLQNINYKRKTTIK